MRFLFSLGLIFFANFTIQAQLQEVIISHNPILAKAAKSEKKATPRTQKGTALPFFDDFAYPDPYPDAALWEDNLVFINNTLANEPVSIGVATFDGLDASGSPYGEFGSADTLTSISLDLSGNAPKYISYYVQPKGLGDAPGIEDKLILEFKNETGKWIEVKAHEVTIEEEFFPLDSIPVFEFIGPITIEDAQFLHDDFQFRFRNFALRNGAVDFWHLDYVRLEANQTVQNNDDLAFTKLPGNIFFNYSSIPWLHLQEDRNGELIIPTVEINLFNHSSMNISTSDSELSIVGINQVGTEAEFRTPKTLLDPANDNITSGVHQFVNPIGGNYVRAYSGNFTTDDKIKVDVNYSFITAEEPLFLGNNQVSRTFDLDNYYAYDDNSAESAYFVGTGGQVAVKFTNFKSDSLRAIRMLIPRIVGGDISESNFTLKVWLADINTEPIYEQPFTKPLFIDEFVDSLQAFTTYVLKDDLTGAFTPVFLPVGDFYIGWQQVTPCANVNCLPVGFDRNTPAATDKILINVDGDWRTIGSYFEDGEVPVSQSGAIMIRPVVGSSTPNDSETVGIDELYLPDLMNIYPNPTKGAINIQVFEGNYSDYQISIFNTLGQQIFQQELNRIIDLSNQLPGIYFLQIRNTKTMRTGNFKLLLN